MFSTRFFAFITSVSNVLCCVIIGGLSLYCVHDVRLSHAGEALLYSRPDEWRRPPLSPLTARRILRERSAILRVRNYSWTGAHAHEIHCLSRSEGTWAWFAISRIESSTERFSSHCLTS